MSTTTTLRAYHGKPELKADVMAQIAAHREADEIAQGNYYKRDGKLSVRAVGCLLHDPNGGHIRYETEFGIPVALAHLEDGLFESMPLDDAKDWPRRFMSAIEPGADLSGVWPRFAAWMMLDDKWGLVHITEAQDVKAVCQRVGDVYVRIASGETITDEEQRAITEAARDARAAWDARAAARAAWDAWAARDAARAAWAAWAAWAARDARDARAAFVVASADKLIELLEQS